MRSEAWLPQKALLRGRPLSLKTLTGFVPHPPWSLTAPQNSLTLRQSEASSGLQPGSLAPVTWALRLEWPCSKAGARSPAFVGHRSTLLYEAEALISDNYLWEKRSGVLTAPSKNLKDRRKLLTMDRGRCISAPMSKTRYCLTDEGRELPETLWWAISCFLILWPPRQTLTNKTSMPPV